MIQKVLVTPIIGLPQINGWAQVTQSLDGTFIVSFSIFGAQAGNVGRDLVDLVSNSSPNSSTAVYSLMKKMVRFVEEKDCRLQIAACYLQNGTTIFSAFNGALLLKRGEKLGCVLQATEEVKLIEGKKSEGDVFILVSQSALPFKDEIFQKLQQGWDADTTVASIVPGVQNLPDSSLVAMAFLTDRPRQEQEQELRQEHWVEEPTIQISVENQSDIKNSEVDAVLGSPMIEVLADSTQSQKKSVGESKIRSLLSATRKKGLKLIALAGVGAKKVGRNLLSVFTKKVYVDEKSRITNKWLRIGLIVLVVLIVLLAGGGVLKFVASSQVKAATLATQADMAIFQETKAQMDKDPILAREKLTQIITNLEIQEKAFVQKKSGQKIIQAQLKEVRLYYDTVSGKQVFNELPVYYDFQLVQSNFVASQSDAFDKVGYFVDRENKKLVKLELDSKKASVIDLASLKVVNDVSVGGESLFILGEGIFERPNSPDGEAKEVVASGKSNENAKLLTVFNGNLYVLNQGQRNIFKYTYDSSAKKFGEPIRWVKSAKGLDFDNISSFAVDGNVWVTTKDGKIFRFSGGEGELLEIRGLVEAFSSQLYLATTDDSEYLYLLEPAQSRLVVLSKQGEFVKEVKSVSMAAGNGVVPFVEGNKVLVVSGTLIFEVGL